MKTNNQEFVRDLFNDISAKYDFLNDLFSLGLHRFWKRKLLSLLKPSSGEIWVDLCCGTGDLSISLAKLVRPTGKICGIDYAEKALSIARKKSLDYPSLSIEWINQDVLNDYKDSECFDGAVMAYGLRNLPDPFLGLKMIRKLLKPGGKAGILDFNSNNQASFSSSFQKFYLRNIVVPIASRMGLKSQYEYIENSIRKFPNGNSQIKLAKKAGFNTARYYSIALGQMGILILEN